MVSVSYKTNYTKLDGSDSCKDFTGLRVALSNGSVKYISYPFLYRKVGAHIHIEGAYGQTVTWSNDEFSKARLDAMMKGVESNTVASNKLTSVEILAMGFCKCQKGIENTSGKADGETSVTYPAALDVLDAPSLTAIWGADGIVFDVSIKSYTTAGFVAYAKDTDGMPYQGNGKIKYSI